MTITHITDGGSQSEREYSDGPVEDEMLSLASSSRYEEERSKILANNPSWPIYYHFTPKRGNIINWKDFSKNSRILEIGAGCGAITEALLSSVDKSVHVDAVELSEKRALINAHRNKKHNNLTIHVGNLENFSGQDYDYIVCVGVLEYAGLFISGNDPFKKFLESLYSMLKPGGEILLAIENKLGTKYINGAREDHVGKYYESLMDYPQYTGVRTFSKKELSGLFRSVKFKELEFYLPIPDYKLPSVVVHEDYLKQPNADTSFISRLSPAPALDQSRVHVGSEQLLTTSFLKAGVYTDLANSFLVRGVR